MKLPSLSRLRALEDRHAERSDDELVDEIAALRLELRDFQRTHRLFRERAHAAVDATIAEARSYAQNAIADIATAQGPVQFLNLRGGLAGDPAATRAAQALSLTSPEFEAAWRAAIDAHPGFSPLTLAEHEAEERRMRTEIREREVELQRRRTVAERETADSELKRLEESV